MSSEEAQVDELGQGPPPQTTAEMVRAMQSPEDLAKLPRREPGSLIKWEFWWRDHQPWLLEQGYKLRPRYSPEWVPSWKTDGVEWSECEDSYASDSRYLLDARRISDGKLVMLKRISKSVHPHEVEITRLFSSESHSSSPQNHCVPLYDVLDVPEEPDSAILVIPHCRMYDDPDFETLGEVIEFFRQLFEGIQYMHNINVAHRDCMNLNIMLDPSEMYPDSYHPVFFARRRTPDLKSVAKYYSRTERPPKYYLIDFGLSRQYDPDAGTPLEPPIRGGDKTVPEFQGEDPAPVNPFPTDIYYLGNLIQEDFIQKRDGFEFMQSLAEDMVQDDPSKRPKISEVVSRFEDIQKTLSAWKLRSRVTRSKENPIIRLYRNFWHLKTRIFYVYKKYPPLPKSGAS